MHTHWPRMHADKARCRSSGEIVALKKVRFDHAKDGVPVTSIRELRVLQGSRHPSIVRLIKVVTGKAADRLVGQGAQADQSRSSRARLQTGRARNREVQEPCPDPCRLLFVVTVKTADGWGQRQRKPSELCSAARSSSLGSPTDVSAPSICPSASLLPPASPGLRPLQLPPPSPALSHTYMQPVPCL